MSRTLTTLCLALLLTPAVLALEVEVEQPPGIDYGQYQTYTWKAVQRPKNHPMHEGSPMDIYTRAVVREHLTLKGLRPAKEGEQADLRVTYDGVLVPELQDVGVRKDLGPGTGTGVSGPDGAGSAPGYRGYFELVFEDVESGEKIWGGRALDAGIAGQPNPTKMQNKIKKAARAVLKRYPAH